MLEKGGLSKERFNIRQVHHEVLIMYSDTSANEDNSFRNHIR